MRNQDLKAAMVLAPFTELSPFRNKFSCKVSDSMSKFLVQDEMFTVCRCVFCTDPIPELLGSWTLQLQNDMAISALSLCS